MRSLHWSEPAIVFVLDRRGVSTEDSNCMDSIFGFHIVFGSGLSQYLGCHIPEEAWRTLHLVRQQLETLRTTVSRLDRSNTRRELDTMDRAQVWPHIPALLEASLACDNLPCDGLGRPPSAGGSFDVDRGTFDVDLQIPEERCICCQC